jgi:hypothetical protein
MEMFREVFEQAAPTQDDVESDDLRAHPLAALYTRQTVDGSELAFNPSKELNGLIPVVRGLVWLSKLSEADWIDPHYFQWRLSSFMVQLAGDEQLMYCIFGEGEEEEEKEDEVGDNSDDDDEADTTSRASGVARERRPMFVDLKRIFSATKLVKSVTESLLYSLAHYFDRRLPDDGALLLCLLLHPCNSGRPSDAEDFRPWGCLTGRFQHLWQKQGTHWVQQPPEEMLVKAMENAENLLREQLKLQWEMEQPAAGAAPRRLSSTAASSSSTSSNSASGNTPNTTPSAAAKKPHLMAGLVGYKAPQAPPVSSQSRNAAVEDQMRYWLNRPSSRPDANMDPKTGRPQTMLQFWERHEDCLLRRVVLRIGPFMISQCATERVNKVPKELWSPDRRSTTPQHIARDVFIRQNEDFLPEVTYRWE